jgi:hypothetical protein
MGGTGHDNRLLDELKRHEVDNPTAEGYIDDRRIRDAHGGCASIRLLACMAD